MRALKWIAVTTVLLCLLLPSRAFALEQTVSSTDLIDNAKQYDGQTVCYAGEVIGDVMLRGDHAWVNVSDGNNAIGIWLTAEQAKVIVHAGDYEVQGDTVKVVGAFYRACPEHGGDMDIHATELTLDGDGGEIKHPLSGGKLAFAVLLFAGAAFLAGMIFFKKM